MNTGVHLLRQKDRQRYLREENAKYGPTMQLVPIDVAPAGPRTSVPVKAWRSRRFLAVLWQEFSGFLRLSVNRTMADMNGDWIDGITWDELQQVKSECGLGEMWGVEAYPPALRVVYDANMRHLFLFEEKPEWAWG